MESLKGEIKFSKPEHYIDEAASSLCVAIDCPETTGSPGCHSCPLANGESLRKALEGKLWSVLDASL